MLTTAALISACGCGADAMTAATTSDAAAALNGCTEAMFVDRSAVTATRVVGFGGAEGSATFTYSPRCITVAAGQSVVFRGDFSAHPLLPGTTPTSAAMGSPIPVQESNSVAEVTVSFPRAGSYPYLCRFHYLGGMSGVVRVR